MRTNVYLMIFVMAGVTYLIRMLPLALVKREITSPFIRSWVFFFYNNKKDTKTNKAQI